MYHLDLMRASCTCVSQHFQKAKSAKTSSIGRRDASLHFPSLAYGSHCSRGIELKSNLQSVCNAEATIARRQREACQQLHLNFQAPVPGSKDSTRVVFRLLASIPTAARLSPRIEGRGRPRRAVKAYEGVLDVTDVCHETRCLLGPEATFGWSRVPPRWHSLGCLQGYSLSSRGRKHLHFVHFHLPASQSGHGVRPLPFSQSALRQGRNAWAVHDSTPASPAHPCSRLFSPAFVSVNYSIVDIITGCFTSFASLIFGLGRRLKFGSQQTILLNREV